MGANMELMRFSPVMETEIIYCTESKQSSPFVSLQAPEKTTSVAEHFYLGKRTMNVSLSPFLQGHVGIVTEAKRGA